MNRDDFPILKDDLIYFDNGATTLKPRRVVDKIVEYYTEYTSNAHRGDYKNSVKVDALYEGVRDKVKDLINAESPKEIVFTKGTTESLNNVVFGFAKNYLHRDDEVLITKSEHASNVLPWQVLEKKIGIKVKYIPLDENHNITEENLEKAITDKTKIVSIAHVTNAMGDVRDIESIGEICKKHNLIFVVDAAQSIGHIQVDVQKANVSFLAFSSHKMLGPTGVGVLYGKKELLEKTEVLEYGGGMNSYFESNGTYELKNIPERFEAGTQNIAGVIGMGEAIDYLREIGLEKIHQHELELKRYAVEKMKQIPNIKIYNENTSSGILIFNIDKVFSQDTAIFLDQFNISVRSGNHCAKILKDEIKVTNTCRISFYLYNTKEEIDKLVEVLNRQDEVYDNIV